MLTWITANLGTIVITALLAVAVAWILFTIIKDKKQGKSSCGGNCAHCKMCTACRDARGGHK